MMKNESTFCIHWLDLRAILFLFAKVYVTRWDFMGISCTCRWGLLGITVNFWDEIWDYQGNPVNIWDSGNS